MDLSALEFSIEKRKKRTDMLERRAASEHRLGNRHLGIAWSTAGSHGATIKYREQKKQNKLSVKT